MVFLSSKSLELQKFWVPTVLSSKRFEFQKGWVPKVLSSKGFEFQKFWVPKALSSDRFEFHKFWVPTILRSNRFEFQPDQRPKIVHDLLPWCFCTIVCVNTQSAQSTISTVWTVTLKTSLTSKTLGLYWSPPQQTIGSAKLSCIFSNGLSLHLALSKHLINCSLQRPRHFPSHRELWL